MSVERGYILEVWRNCERTAKKCAATRNHTYIYSIGIVVCVCVFIERDTDILDTGLPYIYSICSVRRARYRSVDLCVWIEDNGAPASARRRRVCAATRPPRATAVR